MQIAAAALILLVACNQVYGIGETEPLPDADTRPDIDHDLIADVDDPCIAGPLDRTDDGDKDGIPADQDPCPLNPPGLDNDGDGVDNACDVHPAMVGDRRVCTMRFLDEDVTAALWEPRAGERALASASGYLVGFDPADAATTTSMVSVQPLLRSAGTSLVQLGTGPIGLPYQFMLWLSASATTPAASDLGCEINANATSVTAAVSGVVSTGDPPGPAPASNSAYFISATLRPGAAGPNVECLIGYYDSNSVFRTLAAAGHFDGPPQRQGFAVRQGAGFVTFMFVYESD